MKTNKSRVGIVSGVGCMLLSIASFTVAFAQDSTLKAYDNLSLEDLLNVKITSVSKKSEFLFDAPLSASVLTREEIRKAGSTSIMEALRLVPGMIVREESNGNYDIHQRGMDNVPPNASFDITSTTTLVMINDRPIYSYLRGGTFWETLPIGLNDVERIEVIRGPAAALYGPNAVNGVINIITREPAKKGLYALANSEMGSNHTDIKNASLGYQWNKWSLIASGNYQERDRTQTSYFEFNRNRLLDNPTYFLSFNNDTMKNVTARYPDPDLAMEKYGGNAFLSYNMSDKVKFHLTAGAQHSLVQKVSTENEVTPLSTSLSDSKYADLRATIFGATAQVSYNYGKQITDYDPGNKYDFHIFDVNLEYSFTKGNLSIKPGASYRSAIYDDTPYSDTARKAGIFNARGEILTQSAWLRGEYKMFEKKLRLIAGVMANKFNYPDTSYISYELAATYKINNKQLLRAIYSRAPRSSTVFDTYVNQRVAFYPTGYKNFAMLALIGNKNLKLLNANMIEIGYRGTIAKGLDIDVELFHTSAKNYNILTTSAPFTTISGTDTIRVTPIILTNLPLKWSQKGITFSLSYTSSKIMLRPFVTFQTSVIKNYAPYNNTPDAPMPDAEIHNIYSGMGNTQKAQSTPTVFGGATFNYAVNPKINASLTAYYYSSQSYNHISNILFNDGIRGMDQIPAKLILNANLSWEILNDFHFFCTAKNLLNDDSREFFHTDKVPFMLLGGINFEF